MPNWLKNQMQKAFLEKNRYQIKILNQCWFFYLKKIIKRNVKDSEESSSAL
jgi:hypothetical protein